MIKNIGNIISLAILGGFVYYLFGVSDTAFLKLASAFMVGTACFGKLLYFAIQPGNILGGWQNILRKLDENEKTDFITKPLGYCLVCFCHALVVLSFIVFASVTVSVFDAWFSVSWQWLINFLFYGFYVSVTSVLTISLIRL